MSNTAASGGGASRTTDNREALERFAQARAIVGSLWPFLQGAVLRLCPRWTEDCPTMGVDKHWRLYLNPEWVASKHPSMLALIMAGHELQHALGDHSNRLQEYRDYVLVTSQGACSLSNCAHDLAINSGLKAFVDSALAYQQASGRDSSQTIPVALPKEGLYPEQFRTKNGQPFPVGRISEEYARLLVDESAKKMTCKSPSGGKGQKGDGDSKNEGQGDGSDPGDSKKKPRAPGTGSCGSGGGESKQPYEDADEPDLCDPDSGVVEAEQEQIALRTALAIQDQASRMRGTVPGHMERWANLRLLPPKTRWQDVLKRACRMTINKLMGQHDYSYTRRHRRNQDSDIYFPGMLRPDPQFVLIFDTSGSMGAEDFNVGFSEVVGVLRAVGFRKVPVFCCDADTSGVQWIRSVNEVKLVGGGGTDMRVAIRKAVELRYAKLAIVFTDGETPWPEQKEGGLSVIACLTRKPYRMPPDWITSILQD